MRTMNGTTLVDRMCRTDNFAMAINPQDPEGMRMVNSEIAKTNHILEECLDMEEWWPVDAEEWDVGLEKKSEWFYWKDDKLVSLGTNKDEIERAMENGKRFPYLHHN